MCIITIDDEGTLTLSGNGPTYNYFLSGSVFHNNTRIKKIVIERGVTTVGSYLFANCTKVASVSIPNTVISIGDYAFYFNGSLTSIVLPDSVTSIGAAFHSCDYLVSVSLPEGLGNNR